MYLCTCVRTYVCMYAYVYLYIYTPTSLRANACISVCNPTVSTAFFSKSNQPLFAQRVYIRIHPWQVYAARMYLLCVRTNVYMTPIRRYSSIYICIYDTSRRVYMYIRIQVKGTYRHLYVCICVAGMVCVVRLFHVYVPQIYHICRNQSYSLEYKVFRFLSLSSTNLAASAILKYLQLLLFSSSGGSGGSGYDPYFSFRLFSTASSTSSPSSSTSSYFPSSSSSAGLGGPGSEAFSTEDFLLGNSLAGTKARTGADVFTEKSRDCSSSCLLARAPARSLFKSICS